MQLILERSIQERRKRMSAKAKNSVKPNPTPQPKRTSEEPNNSIPRVNPPAPAPAPQLPSQSLRSDTTRTVDGFTWASAKHETPDSSALSKPATEIKVARGGEPPADVKINPSPSEDLVELICPKCNVKQLRSGLSGQSRIYCGLCSGAKKGREMRCVGCGTMGVGKIDACPGCHRRFK